MDQGWLAVAIAIIGNVVALLVIVLSNRAASGRERERLDREDQRAAADRALRVEDRENDDRWRVTELQRDYYVDYVVELRALARLIHNRGHGLGPELRPDWQLAAYDSLERLRVFASAEGAAAASAAYSAAYHWGRAEPTAYQNDYEIAFDAELDAFLAAVRHDLGIVRTASA